MSVGVVIVTHYQLGEEFLQALRLIIPDAPEFGAVAIQPDQPVNQMAADLYRCYMALEHDLDPGLADMLLEVLEDVWGTPWCIIKEMGEYCESTPPQAPQPGVLFESRGREPGLDEQRLLEHLGLVQPCNSQVHHHRW